MLSPTLPYNEIERLAELNALNLSGTSLQKNFDRIVSLACNLFNLPVAGVSLVKDKNQCFQSVQGLSISELPRELAFCSQAILQDDIFIIPDMLLDERFKDSPLVKDKPYIRFYAGYPLSSNNYKIGTLCLIDIKPHNFTASEIASLKDLAILIENEIQRANMAETQYKLIYDLSEAHKESMVDILTCLWNRRGISNILQRKIHEFKNNGRAFGIALLDIDRFKKINDHYGHNIGDSTLRAVAQALFHSCREKDAMGRWGGEEFLVIINETNPDTIFSIAERIRATIEELKIAKDPNTFFHITATVGLTHEVLPTISTFDELVHRADQAMYKGKKAGGNRVIWG